MTRPLLLIAGCGFVACLVSFAVVLALGPVNWDDWNWDMGRQGDHHRGPPIAGDGPTVTREMAWPGGEALHIAIPARITYTQGPVAKVTVTGPKNAVDHLEFDDERLTFDRRIRRPGRIDVVMTAPDVQEFVLAGSQKLTIENYDHEQLEVRIAGSSEVTARGRAQRVEAHIAGAGDIDMGGVESDDGEVHIAGAGKTILSPKLSAEIHIAGSGDVILTTRPPHIEQHIAGSGNITQGDTSVLSPAAPVAPPAPSAPVAPTAPAAPKAKTAA